MLECVAVVISLSLSHITALLSFLVHANVLWLWGARSKMDSFLFAFQIKLYIRKQHVPSKPNADGEKNTESPRSKSHLIQNERASVVYCKERSTNTFYEQNI